MQDPSNLYVGRSGRIFIYYPYIGPEIFHYKSSKWQNPYKVGIGHYKYTLEESLKLYQRHIIDTGLVNNLQELRGKTLGCFCDQRNDCHAKILVKMYENLV